MEDACRKLKEMVERAYFFYSISLGVAVLEPWERNIFHGLLLMILICTVYTTYTFLPGHVLMLSRCFDDFLKSLFLDRNLGNDSKDRAISTS